MPWGCTLGSRHSLSVSTDKGLYTGRVQFFGRWGRTATCHRTSLVMQRLVQSRGELTENANLGSRAVLLVGNFVPRSGNRRADRSPAVVVNSLVSMWSERWEWYFSNKAQGTGSACVCRNLLVLLLSFTVKHSGSVSFDEIVNIARQMRHRSLARELSGKYWCWGCTSLHLLRAPEPGSGLIPGRAP